MSWIKNVGLIVLSPIIFLILFEVMLLVLFKATNSQYFENYNETLQRGIGIDFNELNKKQKKIAVFGGSSAYGYASPLGFAELIQIAYPEELIVHNYSKPGDPFAGFQSEITKLVMPFYDVIVIYAGHNEIWSNLYFKSHNSGESLTLIDGSLIEGSAAIRNLHQRLYSIGSHLSKKIHKTILPINDRLLNTLNSSRIANLMRRILIRLIPQYTNDTIYTRLPLLAETQILTDSDKLNMQTKFSNELNLIKKLLKPHQTLIVSDVMSNDFFPPTLGVVETQISVQLTEKFEEYYKEIYFYKSLELMGLDNTPDNAHKSFLQGLKCHEGKTASSEHCQKLLIEAREKDGIPYRILPQISEIIHKFNTSNNYFKIQVKLPLDKYYAEHFVDFQHPSLLGHMKIANQLIIALGREGQFDTSKYTPNLCEAKLPFKPLRNSRVPILLEFDQNRILEASSTNLEWLNKFIKRSSITDMYEFYIQAAEKNLEHCKALN